MTLTHKQTTGTTKTFEKSWGKLLKTSSSPAVRLVIDQVKEILKSVENGTTPPKRLTQNGESRLPNCYKFDLAGAYRLVMQRHDGVHISRFVGSHEDVDRWLDRNKGKQPTVVERNDKLEIIDAVVSHDRCAAEDSLASTLSDEPYVFLHDELKEELKKAGAPEELVEHIDELLERHGENEDLLAKRISSLGYPSSELQITVLDALRHLLQGEHYEAQQRVSLEVARQEGRLKTHENAFVEALRLGAGGTDFYSEGMLDPNEIERLVATENFEDWLLFLHPDQRAMVDADFNGPARLLGVAGSGKTCVLVHRAVRLAKECPESRILVLTYNRALSQLLSYLLTSMHLPDVAERIHVMSVEQYLRRIILSRDPDRAARMNERDEKSGENIKLCWNDFADKQHALPSIPSIIKAIESYGDRPTTASEYLYDELAWIRSGFPVADRLDYLAADRGGRGIPIPREGDRKSFKNGLSPEGFPSSTRRSLLKLLSDFEEYMEAGELIDREGVTGVAYDYREQILSDESISYRSILVDEYQDLSTLEVEILIHAADARENGLFFVGDPVQKIFPRHHDLKPLGIDFTGRSRMLKKNFRNTRRVLEAAQGIIQPYLSKDAESRAPISASDITPPEYAVVEGSKPLAFSVRTPEEQLRLVSGVVAASPDTDINSIAIISHDDTTLRRMKAILQKQEVASQFLGPGVDYRKGGIKLARLDDVKGFEFSTVLLLDASDPKPGSHAGFPSESVPWSERWRDAMRLYVALTRARDTFHLIYVNNPSYLLASIWDLVLVEDDARPWFDDLTDDWLQSIAEAMREHPTPQQKKAKSFADFIKSSQRLNRRKKRAQSTNVTPDSPRISTSSKRMFPSELAMQELVKLQAKRQIGGGFIGLKRFINVDLKSIGIESTVAHSIVRGWERSGLVEIYQVPNPRGPHSTAAIKPLKV